MAPTGRPSCENAAAWSCTLLIAAAAGLPVELGRLEPELDQLAAAEHGHGDAPADPVLRHQPLHVTGVLDRDAVERDDQILRPKPCLLGRAAGHDLDDL